MDLVGGTQSWVRKADTIGLISSVWPMGLNSISLLGDVESKRTGFLTKTLRVKFFLSSDVF